VIVFSFSVFSTLILLPNILLNYHPMSVKQFVFLVLAGCSAAIAQLSVTAAYQNAPARDISVFDYSQVVYAAMFGFLLWGEIPDALSFLGYAIIIGTAFGKWYWMTKRSPS
jgi:drug/metabolite transporter (DMT)-like permease